MQPRPHRQRILFVAFALLVTLFVTVLGGTSLQRKLQTYQPLGFDAVAMGGGFLVADLDPATSAAGQGGALLPGDVLLMVDGKTAESTDQLRRLLRAEAAAELTVQRGQAILELAYVRPDRRIDPVYPILVLIGILYLLIGLYTRFRDRHPETGLFFAWCATSAAFFLLSPILPPADTADQLIYLVDQLARTLLPALTLHLFLVFPTPLFETLARPAGEGASSKAARWWRIAPLYLPSLGLLAWHADQVFGGGRVFGPATAAQVRAIDRIELILVVGMALLAALGLVVRFARRPGWEYRRQSQLILFGLVAGHVPFLFLYLLPVALGYAPPTWTTVAAVLPMALVPLTFAWAILAYRLLDMGTVLRDLASYSAAAIVGVFGFQLAHVLIREGVAEELALARNTLTFGAGLLIAGVLVPTRNAVASGLERFQHRGLWTQRSLLRELGRDLLLERDMDRLCTTLLEHLDQGLDTHTNLWVRQKRGRFVATRAEGPDPDVSIPRELRIDSLGPELWQREVTSLSPARLPDAGPSAEQRLFAAGYRYAFPIRVRGHRVAILSSAYKRDRDPFDSEDLVLVRGLLDQAALAMENARLVDELQTRLDEVTRLEEWNQGILEASPAGIAVIDQLGSVVSANRAFGDLCGRAADELEGSPVAAVLPIMPLPEPEDGLVEVGYCDADGSEHHVQLDLATHPDTEGGAEGFHVLVARDVSQRVNMESELREKERLAALGMLAAGVAHEVNTPLTGISSYAQFLKAELSDDDPNHAILEKMERQTFRASQIVDNLLDFARNRRGEMGRVDLEAVLRETARLLEHRSLGAGIDLRLELAESDPVEVLGNESELHQVFTNLLNNALEATRGAAHRAAHRAAFGSTNRAPSGETAEPSQAAQPEIVLAVDRADGRIRVRVRDAGPGIAPERLSTIFKPFFSSKLGKGGTGLGLAITYNIVRRHGGEILAENHDDGPGCTFTVLLPPYDSVVR